MKKAKLDQLIESSKQVTIESYELMLILKPLLPEDIRKKTLDTIKSLIESNGGSYKSEDVWGKKHLAYKIKSHEEGYYIVYRINMSVSFANTLGSELKLMPDVLRHLLIKENEL